GDNELPSSVGPVSVTTTPGATVKELAAGSAHTCALLSDGSVKCWGYAFGGEPGNGNKVHIGDNEMPSSVGPRSLTTVPGVTVEALRTGADHTCTLLSDGSVKCWADNSSGQLGYGTTHIIGDNELPSSVGAVSITTTPAVTVKSLTGGGLHTCAPL